MLKVQRTGLPQVFYDLNSFCNQVITYNCNINIIWYMKTVLYYTYLTEISVVFFAKGNILACNVLVDPIQKGKLCVDILSIEVKKSSICDHVLLPRSICLHRSGH